MRDDDAVAFVAATEAEAVIVSGLLTSAGIPSYVIDRSSRLVGAPGQGYDVVVRTIDLAQAHELLDAPVRPSPVDGQTGSGLPRSSSETTKL